jgi:hypothetical protein
VQPDNKKDSESVIDENLKRVFNETLEAGIPDRFMNLLEQLKEQDKQQEAKQDSDR